MELWDFVLEGLRTRPDFIDIPLGHYCSFWQRFLRKYLPNKKLPAWLIINKSLRLLLQELKPGDQIIISAYTQLCLFHAIRSQVARGVGIHLWMWNPVASQSCFANNIHKLKEEGFLLHTFDKDDAARYEMIWHPSFFNMKVTSKKKEPIYDFYFLGAKKNRGELITRIMRQIMPYRNLFVIPSSPKEFISYAKNIENIEKSRCIIEILQSNQRDMTLRTLEALAFHKKLLTNNIHIIEYPFYHSQNIYIYGQDRISYLQEFLNTPFHEINEKIVSSFDVNTWFDSF
jgi:hypothetical protein